MPASGAEVPGWEDHINKKAYKACVPCRQKKRQCENVRPCSSCIKTGSECKDEVENPEETCNLCKQKKLRCDKKRPCDRCCRLGVADNCQSWIKIASASSSRVRRQPDTAVQGSISPANSTSQQRQPDSAGAGSISPSHWSSVRLQSDSSHQGSISPANSSSMRRQPDSTGAGSIAPSNGSLVLRQRDSAVPDRVDETGGSRMTSYKRRRLSPSAPAVVAGGSLPPGPSGGMVLSLSLPQGPDMRYHMRPSAAFLSPEHPLAFPKRPVPAWSSVVPLQAQPSPLPRSLLFILKSYRCSDQIYQQILASMTPRLLNTIIRVCKAIDILLSKLGGRPPKSPDTWELQNQVWQDSARCGMSVLRVDRNFAIISGVDVNTFWSEQLAGLHREEYISRAFAGEQRFPTSELRQFCKMFDTLKYWLRTHLDDPDPSSPKGGLQAMRPCYYRFSRNWGRTDRGPGVLMRVRFHSTLAADEDWVYLQQTMVEVTAAEYEAARAVDPQACEGYMIPVVGSKSAAELLSPRLAQDEAFAHLNSFAEGRATLDRFAAHIEQEYGFLFAALDARNANLNRGQAIPWPHGE